MRVLLTESAAGAADESEKRLREAGYDVSFCHPDHRLDDDKCAVLRGIGRCPLRADPGIGLVMDVRAPDATALPTARELGASCALRHHVPLVVTGPAVTNRRPWSETAAICDDGRPSGVLGRLTSPALATVPLD